MYLRRLRTLMDELLQPLGTAYADRNFENQFDRIYAEIDRAIPWSSATWAI